MPKIRHTHTSAQKRALRVRAKLFGTQARPRVSVSRSNRFMKVQAIDDATGIVVASANDMRVKKPKATTKTAAATLVAGLIADQLKKKKITAVIFDRGSYKYHGRVKAVAEGLRANGITV